MHTLIIIYAVGTLINALMLGIDQYRHALKYDSTDVRVASAAVFTWPGMILMLPGIFGAVLVHQLRRSRRGR